MTLFNNTDELQVTTEQVVCDWTFASQRIKTFLSSHLYVTHCCRCSQGSRAAGRV